MLRIKNKNLEDYKFTDRLSQQEIIQSSTPESIGYKRLAEYKSTMDFRNKVADYVKYLRQNIFMAEDLDLDDDGGRKVPAELLHDLFYSTYSDLPIMKRTEKMASFVAEQNKIRTPELIEKIKMELDFMLIVGGLLSLSAFLRQTAQAMIDNKYPVPVVEDEDKKDKEEKKDKEKKEKEKEKKEKEKKKKSDKVDSVD